MNVLHLDLEMMKPRLALVIQAYVVLYACLHVIWNDNWAFGFMPISAGIVLLLCSLLLCADRVNKSVFLNLEGLAARLDSINPRQRRAACVLISLLSFALFILFRCKHLLGDGRVLLELIGRRGYRFDPHAPLGKYLQSILGDFCKRLFSAELQTSWAITSAVYGAIFVFLLLYLAGQAFTKPLHRLLFFLFILSLGTTQFFFGYIEDYPASYLWLLIYILAARKHLREEADIFLPALCLGIGLTFSMSLFPLGASLLYLLFVDSRRQHGSSRRIKSVTKVAIGSLLPTCAVLTSFSLFYGVNLGNLVSRSHPARGVALFLPLSGANSVYSADHLVDLFSLHLLAAPFSVFLIVVFLAYGAKRIDFTNEFLTFNLLLGAIALVFYSVYKPQLGMYMDWDLFSLPVLPLSISAFILFDQLHHASETRKWIVPMLFVAVTHNAFWILSNHDPTLFRP